MVNLVIAEHDNQSLKAGTLNAVTAAVQIGGDIHVLVAGSGCAAVAEAAGKIAGVSKVLLADDAAYANDLAENLAALIVVQAGNYSHILAPATQSGKNVMPRVAALLDVAQISEITAIEAADTFVRPIYAANALATVKSDDKVKVITVRTTAFEAAAASGGSGAVENVAATPAFAGTRFVGREVAKSERPELASAKVVISGGRALGSSEEFQRVLEPLADKLNAAIGATRAAVDAGYIGNDFQVGQTGKIVAPQLYFAIGISGAIQHVAGITDSKVIVAINKDGDAPIFQVADYGLVADLFEAVPALTGSL